MVELTELKAKIYDLLVQKQLIENEILKTNKQINTYNEQKNKDSTK